METKTDKSLVWIILGILGVCLGGLFLASSVQKPSTSEINYCAEDSQQSKGVVRGIVTDISRQTNGNLLVSLTSGTEGCSTVVSSRRHFFNYTRVGDRIKFKASQSGEFLTVESTPEIDPTVVDSQGNIGEVITIEAAWVRKPKLLDIQDSMLITINHREKDGSTTQHEVEISRKQIEQIELGKRYQISYYKDTKKIADLKLD